MIRARLADLAHWLARYHTRRADWWLDLEEWLTTGYWPPREHNMNQQRDHRA